MCTKRSWSCTASTVTSYGSKRNPDPTHAQEGKRAGTFFTCIRVPKRLAGVLPFHHPSPISSSKTLSRKWHQDKNAGKDLLERGGGGRRKVISCLLLSDLGLHPFLGSSKLAQHIPCKWLRRKIERSEESPQPQAKHGLRGSVGLWSTTSRGESGEHHPWQMPGRAGMRRKQQQLQLSGEKHFILPEEFAGWWRTDLAWDPCSLPTYLREEKSSLSAITHHHVCTLSHKPFLPLGFCTAVTESVSSPPSSHCPVTVHPDTAERTAAEAIPIQTVPPRLSHQQCSCSRIPVPPQESLHQLLQLARGEWSWHSHTFLNVSPDTSLNPTPAVPNSLATGLPVVSEEKSDAYCSVIESFHRSTTQTLSALCFKSCCQCHYCNSLHPDKNTITNSFSFLFCFVCLKTSFYVTFQYQKEKAFKTALLLSLGKICFALKEEVVYTKDETAMLAGG